MNARTHTNTQDAVASPDRGAALLHEAARHKDAYVVHQLCLAGADVEATAGHASNPPLITAASHGSLVTVDALLAAGANPKETNKLGTTALAAACRRYVGPSKHLGSLPSCHSIIASELFAADTLWEVVHSGHVSGHVHVLFVAAHGPGSRG